MDSTVNIWIESNEQGLAPRTTRKSKKKKKKNFAGWGSRKLIKFLDSIGEDTSEMLSHYDLTRVVQQYIIHNKLIHPDNKKRAVCDEKLKNLFGWRTQSISRTKIHDLLKPFLIEEEEEDDEDDSEEDDLYSSLGALSKRLKISTLDQKTLSKKKVIGVSKRPLAAICAENIKHIYLKRSLVEEFLKNPRIFERKVVGSFVRTKTDRYDIYAKSTHRLQLVTGVKGVSSASGNKRSMLQLDNTTEGIRISALSENIFSEDEIEDLRRRFIDGLLEKPTVEQLEQKAVSLHEDIIKHWLAQEIRHLNFLIDQANDRGRTHKVIEYTEKRKLLETPAEQSRLLNEIPVVIPEKVEPHPIPYYPYDCDNQDADDSPKAGDWGMVPFDNSTAKMVLTKVLEPNEIGTSSRGHARSSRLQKGNLIEIEQMKTKFNGHSKPFGPNEASSSRIKVKRTKRNGPAKSLSQIHKDALDIALPDPECFTWFYVDQSKVHGPFQLTTLKRWRESGYFEENFKVWSGGQKPEEAVSLSSILERVFF